MQPSVKTGNKEIIYKEIPPDKNIENLVFCFWQLKTTKALTKPFAYRVVSDGCIDIFFNHNQPINNFVMGFCRKYTEFSIGKEFDYIGIRFLPAAFPILFKINTKELSNQSKKLINVIPNFSEWIGESLNSTQSFNQIVKLLENKLDDLVQNQTFDFDTRFLNSLDLIFKNKGCLDIEKDLKTGLSSRQLRRIFNYYLGTTPKAFSNVVRFQHILKLKPSNQSLKENKNYFDVGFFDQAHFIKNFKTFYGLTPSEAFR